MKPIMRSTLVRWIALLGLACTTTLEAQSSGQITIARVKYDGGGDWYSDPTSLLNLLAALSDRCGLYTAEREATVELSASQLRGHPLLYMTGHGTVEFTSAQARVLREHLIGGGFLWTDDNYGLDKSFREQMAKVFPELSWQQLPRDHPVFSCYYEFPNGLPKIHEHDGGLPQALGLFWRDRLVCLYTYETDIGDGIESEGVHPEDPPEKREAALRMAVNIILYIASS